MPSSALEVAPGVINLIWQARPTTRPLRLLDVGPGWGKYAVLVREYVDPEAEISAVEAWQPYIDRHRLGRLYDEVIAGDVCDQPAELFARFDVVLMADVIEHIDKKAALELIDRIPGAIVISTPRHFFEQPAELPPTEAHVSHWTVADFRDNPRWVTWKPELFHDLAGIICLLGPR